MGKAISYLSSLALSCLALSCIPNDIPYPLLRAAITDIEVEHQCDENGNPGGKAVISKDNNCVDIYVDDLMPLGEGRITKLEITEDAVLSLLEPDVCSDYDALPRGSFASPQGYGCIFDFSRPLAVRLTTYQDYDWTINVHQVIRREIEIDGQIGEPVIDDANRSVVVYVSKDLDLRALKVRKFTLGGQHGSVKPDPSERETYDFSESRHFNVMRGYETESKVWTVHVYPGAEENVSADVFPMTRRAYVRGTMQGGQEVKVEYRRKGDAQWTELGQDMIKASGSRYSAVIEGLSPSTEYVVKAYTAVADGLEIDFATAPATPLTDGSFDSWHCIDRQWNPWAEGGTSFWDTGNKATTMISESISQPTSVAESCDGKGTAAVLESKYLVMKFAAGNIFTGEFVGTDGANGIVHFGRPFSAFPSALKVNYKFRTSTISRSADDDYKHLVGQPDSCQIFIALADWDKPFEVRTRPAVRSVFDPKDPGVIAYGQITLGEDVPQWTEKVIPLEYYATDRTPRYIVVVASASKFGDFFTGGEGTKLWVDNFELLYE